MSIRAWHTYLSIFAAPSVLVFALTGALQLFNLHEAHGSYQPPVIIEKLGRLHKDQVFARDERHAPPPPEISAASPKAPIAPADDDRMSLSTMLLKWLFLFVALALVSSTCLGLWMALTHARRRRVSWALLALGAVLPIALLVA